MLQKSILLNLKIGSRHFSYAMIAAFIGCFFTIRELNTFSGSGGFLTLSATSLLAVVFCLKGLNEIFNKSLFSENGRLYMSLPISEKEIAAGKVIAASIYIAVIELVSILPVLIMSSALQDNFSDLFMGEYILTETMRISSVMDSTATFALLPWRYAFVNLMRTSFLLMVMLAANQRRPGKNTALPWIIFIAANLVFSKVTEFAFTLLPQGFPAFAAQLLHIAVALLLFGIFFSSSCKLLREKYNY